LLKPEQLEAAVHEIVGAMPHAATPQQLLNILWAAPLCEQATLGEVWVYNTHEPEPSVQAHLVRLAHRQSAPLVMRPRQVSVTAPSATLEQLKAGQAVGPGTQADEADALLDELELPNTLADWHLLPLATPERELGLLLLGTRQAGGLPSGETLERVTPHLALRLTACLLEEMQGIAEYEHAALVNAVNDAVLITHTASAELPVLSVNGRFQYMFGVGESLAGTPLKSLIEQVNVPPATRERMLEMHERITENALAVDADEFEIVGVNGQTYRIDWYTSPLINPQDGLVFARLFIFHDVTPERAARQIRSEFLSRVSHELRTPLTAIGGFAELISEEFRGELPDLAQEYVEIIRDSAQKLKFMFSELIELTRVYSGDAELILRTVEATDIVASATKKHHALLNKREQEIRVIAADDLPSIRLDVDRMIQALSNLVENASRYGPTGSVICLRLKHIDKADELPKTAPADTILPTLLIEVTDEGAGVPMAEAERIFEPFYRVPGIWRVYAEGSGLGLAISQSVVNLHRGRIWVQPTDETAPGGRFFVALPAPMDGDVAD